jgi:glycosidase
MSEMGNLELEVGAFGNEVENLHRKLIQHGFEIPPSELDRGFFGPGTRNAVLQWQRDHGLPTTGTVEERTKVTLGEARVSGAVQPANADPAPGLGPVGRPAFSRPQSTGPVVHARSAAPCIGPTEIFSREISQTFAQARDAANNRWMRDVTVNGAVVPVRYPFPSPTDWRDCWMYFLMLDRFANHQAPPNGPWNRRFEHRQGGTFKGVTAQLTYLRELGVKAIWLSPILKNSRPNWQYNYTGYDTQDFMSIDERFGSDGTLASAEEDFMELVAQAHARAIHVIVDIVINHAARVFDYVYHEEVVTQFTDPDVMSAPLGEEPPIQWLNGYGYPRADWQDQIPRGTSISPDDAVYPVDLQEKLFFRRRGAVVSYTLPPSPEAFVKGDFFQRRQLVVEYDAGSSSQDFIQGRYGSKPVLNILIRAYQYLIAKFDLDGFRIDTVKHVEPDAVEIFCNSIREFAQTLGKRNFFTIGEIYDDEETINRFVGRHSTETEGFGLDAALDYPLFFKVPDIVKSQRDVIELPVVFERRKEVEEGLISSHGEAGKYFVTFLDNHDQIRRFNDPSTPQEQITMGLAILFCLQGIPAIYYGTEQALTGTVDNAGNPDLFNNESVREALWGKPNAFDSQNLLYAQIKALSRLREEQPALRFGRLYFRQVSANGRDFGYSSGAGGLVAFSRVVSDVEVLVVANTNTHTPFDGLALQDPDLNRHPRRMLVAYSNLGATGSAMVRVISDARFFSGPELTGKGDISALPIGLAPMEIKVFVPEQPLLF